MDFAKLIAFQASMGAEKPALAFTGGVATYRVLVGSVAVALDRLRGLALQDGAIVAVDVRNPFHHTVLLVALALEGIASVSVQNAFGIGEANLRIDALLADRFAAPAPGLRTVAIDQSWFDHDPKAPLDFAKLMSAPGMAREDRVVRVVLSSGTTGRPKPVAITAGILARRFANGSFTFGGGSMAGARAMSLIGFSTLPAYMMTIGTLCGGGLVCHAPNPREALQIIQMFQVSLLALTPHQLQSVVDAEGAMPAPASLSTVIVGGSRLPRELSAAARAGLCSNIMIGYGTTEAGSIAHAHAGTVEGKEGAVGHILPWAKLQVVDGSGNERAAGEHGLLRVRSNEMASYVNGSLADLVNLDGDWFYPGDVGAIDGNGMVFVTGRSTELINRGGSIIAPDLVEDVLRRNPAVADAAAFGVINASGIEEIWAAVVPSGPFDADALRRQCQEALADKAPDRVIEVSEIPRNDMGKILRRALIDLSGAAEAPQRGV